MKRPEKILFILIVILFSITALAQEGYPPPPRDHRPPPPPRHDGERGKRQAYNIEQATSDRAQLNTIAFSGLAFITGSLGCDTFIPPGKICDHFGFQYMRDVQPQGMGHNTDFLTRIANAMLDCLNDNQLSQLMALARKQEKQVEKLAYMRFPLIKAFRKQLEGDIPSGSNGLNKESVMAYTSKIFELDGRMTSDRAEVFGNILRNLSSGQKAFLSKMEFADYTTWPDVGDRIDKRSMSHDIHVLMMTYAADMFSWYKGSVEADTYFCPERHGTYFGGFYMKDAPAMGHRNYTLSTRLTGDSGEQFLDLLTPVQREHITQIVDRGRNDLMSIVKTRRALSIQLRRCLTESGCDKNPILSLAKQYGRLDGALSFAYAKAFAAVSKTLTPSQKSELVTLRNQNDMPHGAYVYSEPIPMPDIPDATTRNLFHP